MEETITNLNLLNQAIRVATLAHTRQKQFRKGTDLPYIVHPYACAILAQNYTDDPEIIAACLLHDVLEDVSPSIYSEADMRNDFGDSITNLVKLVSEPKTAAAPDSSSTPAERPWRERKESYLQRLHAAEDKRALMISCADKICNLNDMLNDYETIGDALWQKFHADKDELLWFYTSCLAEIRGHVPAAMSDLLAEILARLTNIINH